MSKEIYGIILTVTRKLRVARKLGWQVNDPWSSDHHTGSPSCPSSFWPILQLRDAACGLSHLHSLNPPIAHGRIQSDNVLVLDNLEAALCDYGVSTVRLGLERESKFEVEDPIIGPARYQAKEILEGRMPTPSADVYAFGGLILEVRLTHMLPSEVMLAYHLVPPL